MGRYYRDSVLYQTVTPQHRRTVSIYSPSATDAHCRSCLGHVCSPRRVPLSLPVPQEQCCLFYTQREQLPRRGCAKGISGPSASALWRTHHDPHLRRHPLALQSPRVAVTINQLPFLGRRLPRPHHHQVQLALLSISCRRPAQWGLSQLRMSMKICHSNCHQARTLIPSPIYLTPPSSGKPFLPPQNTA